MATQYIRYPGAAISSGSFPLLAPNGTTTAPSYSFSQEPGLGFYRASSGNVGLIGDHAPGNLQFFVQNLNAAGGVQMNLVNNAASTSDLFFLLSTPTVFSFVFGLDASASQFVMGYNSSTPGTNNAFTMDHTTGAIAIKGTSTNDSAAAAFVGEYISARQTTSTNFSATGTWSDLVTISLTAGDWDVSLIAQFDKNSSTTTIAQFGIGTVTGDNGTGVTNGDSGILINAVTALETTSASIPAFRVSLTATTTYYFKYKATFSAGTPQARGRISARRVR